MGPAEYLQQKKQLIDQTLECYLSQENSPVFEAMRYSVLDGGKRFRPLLLMACGEYFGAPEKLLLPYACAIELIHSYSLVHDDLPMMDNDDYRRGKFSCHKKFGQGLALLAGDGLLSLAFEILAEAPAPEQNPQIKDMIISEIARTIGPSGMIAGQYLDISFSPDNQDVSVDQEIALKKTAGLIRVSGVSGARLAGASPVQVEAVEKFGTYLGLAFQLRDDLEDLAQDLSVSKPLRPNLASILGVESSLELLEELRSKAENSLREFKIYSDILEFFIHQIQFQPEKKA